jgi:hypothetical protein
MSAGSYTNLVVLVGRVFQRAPGLIRDIENQLEGMSFTRKNISLVELVLDKIGKLVGAGMALVLPISLVCLTRCGTTLPTRTWWWSE